jgi:hypothetical protein
LSDEFGVAADLDEPGSVAWVDDEQADLLVLEQIAALLPFEGRVHQRAPATQADPYHGRLRLAVMAERGEHAANRPGQQL